MQSPGAEEKPSGSDQWVWMFVLGLGPAKITLWASPSWQSSQSHQWTLFQLSCLQRRNFDIFVIFDIFFIYISILMLLSTLISIYWFKYQQVVPLKCNFDETEGDRKSNALAREDSSSVSLFVRLSSPSIGSTQRLGCNGPEITHFLWLPLHRNDSSSIMEISLS